MSSRMPKPDRQGTRPKEWIYSCGLCQKDHALKTCARFLSIGPDERFEVVCQHHYCINCLARSHTRLNCPTKSSCQICHQKHNTLLHFATQLRELSSRKDERIVQPQPRSSCPRGRSQERAVRPASRAEHLSTARRQPIRSVSKIRLTPKPSAPFKWSKVFIATAQIKVAIPNEPGMWHTCRIGLNFHSTVSRIAVSLQSHLQLKTFEYRDARFAKVRVTGRLNRFKWGKEIRAMLTHDLPRKPYEQPMETDPTNDFPNDTLADSDPRRNTAIDLELGADEFPDLWRNGSIATSVPYVVAQQTAIGYTFTGPVGKIW